VPTFSHVQSHTFSAEVNITYFNITYYFTNSLGHLSALKATDFVNTDITNSSGYLSALKSTGFVEVHAGVPVPGTNDFKDTVLYDRQWE
jgi:hypothetical protein